MAGENGEGCGDDLNVLGLQVTLRIFLELIHQTSCTCVPNVVSLLKPICIVDMMYVPTGATREFNAAEIGALAHLYRGEIYRSTAWRTRLDNTTNWSVAGLGLAMSISFSRPDASALPILLMGVLIVVFLFFEARRYRYFNVFRARARWMETNFYAPMLLGKGCICGTGWEKFVPRLGAARAAGALRLEADLRARVGARRDVDHQPLVEIYTPAAGVVAGVAPTINALTGSVGSPSTNTVLSGTQLNGLSEANAYGDDYQGATNYPLVRFVQAAAPHNVYYATTHDESTHSIAPGTSNSTKFDVPAGVPAGTYNVVAVANGIQSNAIVVDVVAGAGFSLSASPSSVGIVQGSSGTSTITVTPQNGFNGSVTLSASGLPSGVTAGFNPNPTTTTSTLTLAASATATTGTFTVTITGVSGSITATTTLTLTVNPSNTGPPVTVSPTSLLWGTVVLGATGPAKAVTLTNTGSVTLNISSIATSGDFALAASTKPCGSTLAAGKSCIIKVTFTPTALGTRTGTLTLTDNSPSSPQTVALSGTGGVPVKLTPVAATFPKEPVGVSSLAKVFTLKNLQAVALTGISVATTGDFSVSATTCATSLAAKSTCTISVVFTPTQTGTRTGTLQVSDSAAGSPQISTLSGTGK